MAQTFDHLHTGVWSFLDESQEERITRLYMPKWVSYEGASEALARMGHLLRHPPCGRMPSMLLSIELKLYLPEAVWCLGRQPVFLQKTPTSRQS